MPSQTARVPDSPVRKTTTSEPAAAMTAATAMTICITRAHTGRRDLHPVVEEAVPDPLADRDDRHGDRPGQHHQPESLVSEHGGDRSDHLLERLACRLRDRHEHDHEQSGERHDEPETTAGGGPEHGKQQGEGGERDEDHRRVDEKWMERKVVERPVEVHA